MDYGNTKVNISTEENSSSHVTDEGQRKGGRKAPSAQNILERPGLPYSRAKLRYMKYLVEFLEHNTFPTMA